MEVASILNNLFQQKFLLKPTPFGGFVRPHLLQFFRCPAQGFHDSIRRAEFILVDLAYGDPTDVVVLQRLGRTLPNGGVEQRQVNRQMGYSWTTSINASPTSSVTASSSRPSRISAPVPWFLRAPPRCHKLPQ